MLDRMNRLRKTGRIVLRAILGLVLLSALLILAVQQPAVQRWLTGKATVILSRKLGTTVTISGVDIDFFKTAVLENIYIADQRGDTLLYARRLSADIGLVDLLRSEIYLNTATLSDAVVHLRRTAADPVFNYQFILDSLASDTPRDSMAGAWTFGIGRATLDHVQFSMQDEGAGRFDLKTSINRLIVTADQLDFKNKKIALNTLALNQSDIAFRQLEKKTETSGQAASLQFPDFGWTVSVEKIELANNHIGYFDDNAPRLEHALDYSHLDLRQTNLSIDRFYFAGDAIRGTIRRAAFRDQSGFQLDELAGAVQILPQKIEVKNLVLKTPKSAVFNSTNLVFNTFDDLSDPLKRVKIESDVAESQLAVSDLLLLAPALRQLKNVQFPEGNILHVQGKLVLENNRLTVDRLIFSADESTWLDASGSIAALDTEPRYDLYVRRLSTTYQSLRGYTRGIQLPPALQDFGRVDVSGHILGTLGDLAASDLTINTQSATRFSGDLRAKGLPDLGKTVFDLNVKNLSTRPADFHGFSVKPLPPLLDSLGLVQFAGKFKGTIRDFDLAGKFQTSAGAAQTDLALQFNDDYTFARYRGKLMLDHFDFGQVLGDTSQLGAVSLNLQLDGQGLNLDTLNTTLKGVVQEFVFRDYTYRNLLVDGRFVQRLFEGNLALQDDNLHFDLSGKINLNDSLPALDATVHIDTVDFKKLHLSDQDIRLSGQVEAKFSGNHPDNFRGQAVLSNLALSGDDHHYFDPKIVLRAEQLGAGNRALRFDAGFLNARIEGRYNFRNLPGLVIGYINDFFPVEQLVPDSGRSTAASQQFEFEFRFINLTPVARIFLPGFSNVSPSAYLKGRFDSAEKQLELSGVFPNIELREGRADSVLIDISGDRKQLESSVQLRHFNYGGTFYAPILDLHTRMGADTLRFDVAVQDDSLHTNFGWGGRTSGTAAQYQLVFDPELILNREAWAVDAKNSIGFSSKDLQIKDLVLSKNEQSIGITTTGATPAGDLAPVEVQFNHFLLGEISNLLNNPDLRLGGALDGKLVVREPRNNLHYNAALQVQGLTLNDQTVGELSVEAAQPAGKRVIEMTTRLTGANTASLHGSYDPRARQFDVTAEIGRLILVVADPFLKTFIRKSEGYVSGNFTLRGTPDRPALNGRITTHDISTEVVLSGTRYRNTENTITFSESAIDFGQMTLFDAGDRKAALSGKIYHTYFDSIQMDMRVQTNGLQILNTSRDDNRLYYGKLFAKADVRITGPPELPRLDVVATTLDSSLLHVEPLTTELVVVHEDYLIFANPNLYLPDSLRLLEQQLGAGRGGFDLNLVLEVTPEARLNIILDPQTGDELFCSGRGNFIIRMNPAGEVSVTGAYVIEEGNYSFNYQGLVKRDFVIRKGSSLTFTGDPYNARFDINAVYKTRATTYELISNETTLDETTLQESQRRTDVEVALHISGGLAEPDISFDINLPANQGGLVDNLADRKLADLRDDPTELNKQVFGLLFFNSFILSETGAGLANVGENVALKSVSGLITNQLNRLAGRLIKGVNLTLGFESYRAAGQTAGTVTEMKVGLSKQLFNERLTIKVGGNFNLKNAGQSAATAGGYSAIAGDFVLEYKLDKRGVYLLQVFHKSDYNLLLDANTSKTGVGILFRKSY